MLTTKKPLLSLLLKQQVFFMVPKNIWLQYLLLLFSAFTVQLKIKFLSEVYIWKKNVSFSFLKSLNKF